MYNQNSGSVRHKNQATVRITLAGIEPFDAIVFLSIGDRLIDLLNDDRSFIPVRRNDGETIIVAKTQIQSIIESGAEDAADAEREDEKPKAGKKFDPYAMLRISPDATIEEVRTAYKARVKAVHPDSIAALGLDEDLAKAALQATQKVNYAYRKIMRDREDAGKADTEQTAQRAAG